jgi:hypothetical protein
MADFGRRKRMKAEMIDGVLVPGWKIAQWVWTDRVRYFRAKKIEAAWRWTAAHLPRELRKWVVVNTASKVWVDENANPDEITYARMYDAVEPRSGR